MKITYKEIVLEDGLVKVKPIDYFALKEEEKKCYYEVDRVLLFSSDVVLICNIKYATLSNQN